MAKLSEIMGGIAKDLLQFQASSDLSSSELHAYYKNDALLKFIDIPRFTVKNINMKIKFAIQANDLQSNSKEIERFLNSKWRNILFGEILDNIITATPKLREGEKAAIRKELKEKQSNSKNIEFDMGKLLQDKQSKTVKTSVSEIVKLFNALPPTLKARLPAQRSLSTLITKHTTLKFNEIKPLLLSTGQTKIASERNLDVVIDNETLKNYDESQIHEMSFTVTPDYLKMES